MAFSQNHSLSYICVEEPNLLGMSRSIYTTVPTDKLFRGHPCEAYICTVRDSELLRIYVAIIDTSTRTPHIFTSECDAKESAVFKKLAAEAEEFAVSMGFFLEPVDMNYSPAMRQVIMRGISILQPPDPARTSKKVVARAVPDTTSLNATPPKPHLSLVVTSPETSLGASPLSDKVLEPTASVEEVNQLRLELEELTRKMIAAEVAAEKKANDLKTQLDCAVTARKKAEKALQDELGHRADRLEASVAGESDLLKDERGKAEEARKVAEEAARGIQELESRLAEAHAASQATERGLQAIVEELRNEVAVLHDSLKTNESERQVLIEELDSVTLALRAAEAKWCEEREVLERKNEKQCDEYKQLEALLAEARKTNEDLVLEQELERRRAVGELNSITSKLERLSAEKNVWDSIALSFKKKARTAVERLRREKGALEEQLQQLVEKGNDAVQPQGGAKIAIHPETFYESSAVAGFSLGPAFTGFAAATAGSAADFRFAPEINAVIYHSAEEIIDLYGSGNMIQAAPFGRRSQNCNAYICVVERGGQREINLAWQLVDNGEVLICLPEKQPDETGNYDRMLQDALFYFESVGFMMNRFEISRGSERQLQALEKTGICRREEKQEGADPWLMIAAA